MNRFFNKIIWIVIPVFAYISYLAFKHIDEKESHIYKLNDNVLINSKLFTNAQTSADVLIDCFLPILLFFLWLNFLVGYFCKNKIIFIVVNFFLFLAFLMVTSEAVRIFNNL